MYREKILLRQRVVTQDELMQDIESYVDWGRPWAMVKTSRNGEVMSAAQEQMKIQKRYILKYSKSLDGFIDAEKTSFEIIHKGIAYDVKEAINDNDLNQTITVYVEGRVWYDINRTISRWN